MRETLKGVKTMPSVDEALSQACEEASLTQLVMDEPAGGFLGFGDLATVDFLDWMGDDGFPGDDAMEQDEEAFEGGFPMDLGFTGEGPMDPGFSVEDVRKLEAPIISFSALLDSAWRFNKEFPSGTPSAPPKAGICAGTPKAGTPHALAFAPDTPEQSLW